MSNNKPKRVTYHSFSQAVVPPTSPQAFLAQHMETTITELLIQFDAINPGGIVC